MPLQPLDVIVVYDDFIKPPGPKLWVCIEPTSGFFLRINSKPWPTPILVRKHPNHSFLDHDSYVECGEFLVADDYVIDESVRRHGILGRFDRATGQAIYAIIATTPTIVQKDKELIRVALGG